MEHDLLTTLAGEMNDGEAVLENFHRMSLLVREPLHCGRCSRYPVASIPMLKHSIACPKEGQDGSEMDHLYEGGTQPEWCKVYGATSGAQDHCGRWWSKE